MQVSTSTKPSAFSTNPELIIADTSAWIAENWLRIAIAVGVAVALVAIFLTIQKLAQRLCREEQALVSWRTIIGRLAARTRFWFLLILSARIVDGYAAAPEWLDSTISFLFTVGMTLQAAIWARELVLGVIEHRAGDAQHGNGALGSAMGIIRALVTFLVFAIALVLILGNLGVNIAGLVAGLGVGGIAIGLAAQGIFSDLFAGISILFDRPFKVGDMIAWGDSQGNVEQIGMRTTRVRLVSGELLIVSNKNLLDKEIRNITVRDHIRLTFGIGVLYETKTETLARIPGMLKEIGEAENVKVARAGFEGFGESSLDFMYIIDVPGSDWGIAHPTRDRLLVSLVERFAAEGIGFAYPTQTSYMAAPDGTIIMPYPEGAVVPMRDATPAEAP